MKKYLSVLIIPLMMGLACPDMRLQDTSGPPDQRTNSPGDSKHVKQTGQNQGGVQIQKEYNDGDPWPFRLLAGGLASAGLAGVIGYWRYLRRKKQENVCDTKSYSQVETPTSRNKMFRQWRFLKGRRHTTSRS